jgi:GMP synthase-like glutamine amidotransferase
VKFLVVESETAEDREARRQRAGMSSGETYQATLEQLSPGAKVSRFAPDQEGEAPSVDALAAFDAVFVSGSPLHVYERTPAVERQIALMQSIFSSGTPAFGSCAGLQLAVVAAGGRVHEMPHRLEAGVARRIYRTRDGEGHPLLASRPPVWDAASIHTDEVVELPDGGVLLATNGTTRVQAAEIRHERGVFWGVQYHPELAPGEIASALRGQDQSIVDAGLAEDKAAVERCADLFDRLQRDPSDGTARWQLGVDAQLAEESLRRTELSNFIIAAPRLRDGAQRDKSHDAI